MRLDTYGCGCQHNCKYCYAKSLLDFRKLWDPAHPSIVNIQKVHRTILRNLHEGDIVKVDVGAYINGFHGDCACTIPCGEVSEEARKLIAVTRQSFYEGIKFARKGNRISDISNAIQTYVEAQGFSLVRDYVGHGVGANLHEDPEVPNFGRPGHGVRLQPGMTLAIEPMVNVGTYAVKVLPDGWTVKTADGKLSAHYENSIAITEGDPVILTFPTDGENW